MRGEYKNESEIDENICETGGIEKVEERKDGIERETKRGKREEETEWEEEEEGPVAPCIRPAAHHFI
ncbi:MAG TPA: hypothetical protein V6C97_07750 [Oculatellaceae cyanobacterium]